MPANPSESKSAEVAEEFEADGSGMERRYEREALEPGDWFDGPAVVTQLDATTVIPRGWRARVDGYLNLVVERLDG